MRIKVELSAERKISVPKGYNAIIQAFVYNFLSRENAEWLHNSGFQYEKRHYKLFTFSGFLEKAVYKKEQSAFIFPSTISFYFSTPIEWIAKDFAQNFIKQNFAKINNQTLFIRSVEVLASPEFTSNEYIIKTVTPITMHSTFETNMGKKKTHYYTPFEDDFSELINANLKKKWEAAFGTACNDDIKLKPLFSTNENERIQYFGTGKNGKKPTVVKGWQGKYKLMGNPLLLQFAYDAGLGDRNSQGFGMFDVWEEKSQKSV
jgi:CRISPR-associated endoribonuclease Cas6